MKKALLVFLYILIAYTPANAQMATRVVRDSLFIPWEMVYGLDNRIWFTQKNGYICNMDPLSGHIDTLYHETNVVIQSEGGMLGMALHPDMVNTPLVFVAYDYMKGTTYTERIVKYQYDAVNNKLSNPQIVLDNIGAANFHNGCRLLIANNYLYITTGDATNGPVAQNLGAINGKILRLALDGSIPTDNPIAGSPVWSWGHRNPQGLVFANNKLYEAEHGPNNDDEVNIIQKSRNYGWPNVEGFCNLPAEATFCTDSNVVEPVKAWTPTLAVCGLDYYDHPMFPTLQKSLLMATLKDKHLYQLKLNSSLDAITLATVISQVSAGRLRDICIAPDGKIYLSTSNSDASGNGSRIDKIIELYDPSFTSISKNVLSSNIKIYPNPGTDIFTIAMDAGTYHAGMRYTVTGVLGQTVAEGALGSNVTSINAHGWAAGVYLIKLIDNTTVLPTYQIIKQ